MALPGNVPDPAVKGHEETLRSAARYRPGIRRYLGLVE
jgi:hypothetical protein